MVASPTSLPPFPAVVAAHLRRRQHRSQMPACRCGAGPPCARATGAMSPSHRLPTTPATRRRWTRPPPAITTALRIWGARVAETRNAWEDTALADQAIMATTPGRRDRNTVDGR
ncbi:hypothetical protein HYPSUDRAFT_209849 [Hypholoma sublateritium FD-334 SS-4]|uniref:Uncharacterized protein n=1 Tax=Hypholoma sublateritium (strain FD-334 SS-4) TaxID=945553 RepID=A0A0D2KF46_HYPSF|nr:hypothetical protein HYPSUDRAFT_209849 [Hypholoma sublateritium FD-334 SS-4]